MSEAISSGSGGRNTDQSMDESWVKLYRKLKEWSWADNPNMVALWVRLLIEVNYEDRQWHDIIVRRGQLVTSVASLSAKTGLSFKKIRTCIDRLEKTGEIIKKTTNKYTVITLCNFEIYQPQLEAEGQTNGKQTANNGQTEGNQRATPKEIKKERNIISPSKEGVWVLDFFNEEMEMSGAVIPKVHKIAENSKRAGAISARIREHGEEAVKEMIRKAAKSDFLNGKNQRGWTASFDWLFLPSNFEKVYEGNYDNHGTTINNQRPADPRQAEREQLARGYAATMSRLAAEDDARSIDVRQPGGVFGEAWPESSD